MTDHPAYTPSDLDRARRKALPGHLRALAAMLEVRPDLIAPQSIEEDGVTWHLTSRIDTDGADWRELARELQAAFASEAGGWHDTEITTFVKVSSEFGTRVGKVSLYLPMFEWEKVDGELVRADLSEFVGTGSVRADG